MTMGIVSCDYQVITADQSIDGNIECWALVHFSPNACSLDLYRQHRRRTKPKVIKTTIELQEEKHQQKQFYDRHAKELTTLQPGQNVRVQFRQQWKAAVVSSVSSEPKIVQYQNL